VSGTSGGTLFRFSAAADADRAAGPQTNWTNSRGAPVVTTLCVNDVAAGITSTPCVRQDATLWSLGVSSQAEATRGDWSLSVGSRWDDVRIDVANRIRPTQSIAKRWTQLSPKVALTWRAQPTWTWWASLARGFDPPTATELTTSPDTLKGFNDALAPASQWQWELGTRGVTPRGISYEATGFVADVRNDFVSRTVAIPGVAQPRAYFENAARARRTGIELGASAPLSSAWRVGATYTWSHFVFTDFKGTLTGPTFSADSVNYVGRAVPGIAPHRATVEARWQPEGPIAVTLWGEYNAKTYVDFANTDSGLVYLRTSPLTRPAAGRAIPFTAMPASALLHASMTWRLRDAALLFTADNLLNSKWISSASLNATNGKFYFPGPGRTISFGMSLGTLRP
jgi:iron complex outermembrane receptor protein